MFLFELCAEMLELYFFELFQKETVTKLQDGLPLCCTKDKSGWVQKMYVWTDLPIDGCPSRAASRINIPRPFM